MSVREKMLMKSNSYKFYKSETELLTDARKRMSREIKFKDKYIDFLQRDLKTRQRTISRLEENIEFKRDTIDVLKKDIKFKNDEIDVLVEDKNELTFRLNECEELIKIFEEKYRSKCPIFKENMKDLNIGYVLRGFPILSETFIVSEVRWLKEQGFNVTVFTNIPSYKPVDLDFYVENHRFETPSQLETLLIKHDIDLVHTHFVYPICTYYTHPVADKLNIPFTVFAHAFDIFRYEEDRLNNIAEISKSPNCLAVFTLSDYHKNYLAQRGVVEDKIIVTKQASDYVVSPIKEREGKVKNIVSVSRFVEKKGIDVLIDAAKLLEDEDFNFSIYGFGDLEKQYKQQIEELECTNIQLKGELHHSDVKDVLTNADLLVAPSKIDSKGDRDGFPTVIFEAMAVGLPILSTKVSAIPEIITDGVNGFLTEPEKPEMLAEKIREISRLSDDELLKIRKQAQIDVENVSSVEKTMERYIETVDYSNE